VSGQKLDQGLQNDSAGVEGFILQASYRVHQGVPVVYLFGRLNDGRTFLVTDNRVRPCFFVRDDDAKHVRRAKLTPSVRRSFSGESLSRVEVGIPQDAPTVRDNLHAQGVATYEADVRFAMRYLIDRNIRGGVRIVGSASAVDGLDVRFENPQLYPSQSQITPRILSFDIETNPHTDELLAIACFGCGVDEVVIVDPGRRQMPASAIGVGDAKAALAHFADLVARVNPDVITGWNVIDFDLTQLESFAKRCRYDLQLGRVHGRMRIRPAEGYFGSGSANIPGRLVLDGMDLLRGAFIKTEDFSLDTVAKEVLGEGKTLHDESGEAARGHDKVAQILDTYRHDLGAFAYYARTDARLALQIVEQLRVVELAFARSALTGMPPDRVAASIASFDFLYLAALTRQGIAAPSVSSNFANSGQTGSSRVPQGGGAVFEPKVGIHRNVWVCDFKSLYPSIIRTFNIDPLGYARAQQELEGERGIPTNPDTEFRDDLVRTQDGTAFSREAGILPDMLNQLFPERAQAKASGNDTASQAIKILMNSFYGVLGTSACRFYNPHIANAITSQGRHLLNWTKDWFEARGYEVLYGDTDSVFVASGMAAESAHETALTLMESFNSELQAYLSDQYGVHSYLELEFEKLYTQLFLAATRGGGQGARKRYAGRRLGEEDVEFVGMEVVRRDWTDLAKEIQRNLFTRLFEGNEVATYLAEVVAALRNGELDEQLVYRRGLRKDVDSYTTHVPPHVQAVKRSRAYNERGVSPRIVRYVMTEEGPQLFDEINADYDREHYLERQVRPVAETVLDALGLQFNQVIGDDRQISLF